MGPSNRGSQRTGSAEAVSARRSWLTLGALAFGFFMAALDTTVVNVALPSIQRDLDADISKLEWVVNGYVLALAVFMLTGGKLADFLGRRRIFLLGIATFTLASLAGGLAPNVDALIAARAVQGLGAAMMMPASLSLIAATFAPEKRGTAIGIWAGISAVAAAVGPVLGGWLTDSLDWSWVFFINVPIGLIGFLSARAIVEESRDASPGQRLDLAGLLVSGAALLALTYALIEANDYGWGSTTIVALLALAGAGLILFVWVERRRAEPMLDLSLFRSREFTGASLMGVLSMASLFGVFFFLSIYLQFILGYSPVKAGATFVPLSVTAMVAAPAAGRLTDRIGARLPMTVGLVLLGVAFALYSALDARSSFADVVPGLVVTGLGIALTQVPMMTSGLAAVDVAKSGVASAVLNTFRQVGGAIGIAVLAAILTSRMESAMAAGANHADAFLEGYQRALLVGAGLALVGALATALLMRRPLRRAATPAPRETETPARTAVPAGRP